MMSAEDVLAIISDPALGGTTATLTSWTDNFDPSTGINNRTPVETAVTCSPLLPPEGRAMRPGDTSARATGVLYIPVLGSTVVPKEGMQVRYGNSEHTITAVSTIPQEPGPLVYEVRVAQGGQA